jgi:hypothetical protein
MIAKLTAWLKDHSITTHSVASAYTILVGYYAVSADFRNQVAITYQAIQSHIPAGLKPWIGIGTGLYIWYRSGKKKEPNTAGA